MPQLPLQCEAEAGKLVYYRLIALWILCEAMLGGIIHGAKIPVSGLIVGSCAVICISLIAYYARTKGCILRATLIVAAFKMMLSPQAPPAAYFALFFQGLMGEALFWNRRMYPVSCLLLGVLVLLESGLQRVVILTVIYGNELWRAVNIVINGITRQASLINYSYFFITAYVLIHLVVGVLIGLLACRLPQKIRLWSTQHQEYLLTTDISNTENLTSIIPQKRKRKLRKAAIYFTWTTLVLLYLQSSFNIGQVLLPSNLAFIILIRSVLVISTFYYILRPCLTWLLNRWLQKTKVSENEMIQKILQLLPDTKQLVSKSWQLSADHKGVKRLVLCSKIILLNTLQAAHD